MPIPGLEDLLPPAAPSGRGRPRQQEAGSPILPVPPSPSVTQRCPCNFSSALGAPGQGVGRSPVKAGLAVASAGPVAD